MVIAHHILSGALSGGTAVLVLQPLDLLKTRLQQGDLIPRQQKPISLVAISRDIIVRDGWLGLWRGTLPTLARNVPGTAIYLSLLQQVRRALARSPRFGSYPGPQTASVSTLPTISAGGNLLAGAVTRVGVGFVLNPFAIVKARFESNIYAYKSIPQALRSIYAAGLPSLFRGFAPSAMRDAPYAGIFLVIYERVKEKSGTLHIRGYISAQNHPATAVAFQPNSLISTAIIHGASGASAGTIATILTHPFDTIKTQMQVRPEAEYRSLFRTVAKMWTARGPLGFFDGVSLRLSKKVLSSVISWTVYEGVLIIMKSATNDTD